MQAETFRACAQSYSSVTFPGYATRKANRFRAVLHHLQYAGRYRPSAQAEGRQNMEGLQAGKILLDLPRAQADEAEGGETLGVGKNNDQ